MQPDRVFELQMLAHEVVTQLTRQRDVAPQRLGIGCRESSVGPVALVEHAAHVQPRPVQHELLTASLDAAKPGGRDDAVRELVVPD